MYNIVTKRRNLTFDLDCIKNYDFAKFGKNGIPLRYTRAGFLDCSEKFFEHNETLFKEPEMKTIFDKIIKDFPEFTELIGKIQHKTHNYSTDIHTLKVLQSCLKNPRYNELTNDGKFVLQIAVLLHDTGKKEAVVTPGHAAISAEIAENTLKRFIYPDNIKSRIIKIIKNHHWFESYNKGFINAFDTAEIFETEEDFLIAFIIAKSDFSNINDTFHLEIIGCENNIEFEKYMNFKIKIIEDILSQKVIKKPLQLLS